MLNTDIDLYDKLRHDYCVEPKFLVVWFTKIDSPFILCRGLKKKGE